MLTEYVYAATGARLKMVTEVGTPGEAETLYLGPLEVRDFGTTSATHVATPHPDVRLVEGVASHLHRDQLGSVVMITDSAGAKARQTQYAPFGAVVLAQTFDPAVAPEARGFIGERFDADAGLQYLNARYYDPELGLFLQPDWFEVTDAGVGTNRYAYAGGDPVNLRDPGGNQSRGGSAVPNYSHLPSWQLNNQIIRNLTGQVQLINPNYSAMRPPAEQISPRAQRRIINGLRRDLRSEQWAQRQSFEAINGRESPLGSHQDATVSPMLRGVNQGLRISGQRDAIAFLQGSAVTGTRYTTGELFRLPSQSGPSLSSRGPSASDYDVAIASPNLYARAVTLPGAFIRNSGGVERVVRINEQQMQTLGLGSVYRNAQRAANSTVVNFAIFRDASQAYNWRPSFLGTD
ncbi:RHS repeat-associated core domain-containing protein [Octadecabacter sp. R77987]|uniref:RHS repeat-associated core domain-containing protein n=1 Tax=Octadecabacter sp. R77987 TaxID=3093874 RepID=UPI00367120B8